MQLKLSQAYLAALFTPGSYGNLVEISTLLCGSSQFSPEKGDYGLNVQLFLLVEGLAWFAQSTRSGACTYFEATDPKRQTFMLAALKADGPEAFAQQYAFGAAHWRDKEAMEQLDQWMGEMDYENNNWLWRVAQNQQSQFLQVVSCF